MGKKLCTLDWWVGAMTCVNPTDAEEVSGFLCAGLLNDSEGFRYLDLEI